MKSYTVTFHANRRFEFVHEFESALMALDAVLDILRELRDPDFDWEEGPDQLLADVAQMMHKTVDHGERLETCVLPGRLYITAQEKARDSEEEASGERRDFISICDGYAGGNGNSKCSFPTGKGDLPGANSGHYCAVTPAGGVVFRGTEKECADYIDRMERLGHVETRGYLSVEPMEDKT